MTLGLTVLKPGSGAIFAPDMRDWSADEISHEIGPIWLHVLRRKRMQERGFSNENATALTEAFKSVCGRCRSPIEARLAAGLLGHNWGRSAKPITAEISANDADFVSGTGAVRIMPQCGFFGYQIDFAMCSVRSGRPVFAAIEAEGAAT